ncbi:MAG: CPBP family intramembrane glutamic endopeptidase [Chlamydiota bacterium]
MKNYLCCMTILSFSLFSENAPLSGDHVRGDHALSKRVANDHHLGNVSDATQPLEDKRTSEENLIASNTELSKEDSLVAIGTTNPLALPQEAGTMINPTSQIELPEPVIKVPYKSALIATGLSTLIPGLGHVYLDELSSAVGYFGAAFLSGFYALYPWDFSTDEPDLQVEGLVMNQNTHFLSMYAAYRDARAFNGHDTYAYKMPTDNLDDLTYASFSYATLSKPEVWGGVIGAFSLATLVSYMAYYEEAQMRPTLSLDDPIFPFLAFPIGMGEEALFRGVLQSTLIEKTGPATGIALSSLLFGLAHMPNAAALDEDLRLRYFTVSIPFITALGGYFGFLTHKNSSLKEAVAVHAWYDFALFSLAYFFDAEDYEEASIKKPKSFSFSWSF